MDKWGRAWSDENEPRAVRHKKQCEPGILWINFFHQKSRLSRAKYTVILFPETPCFNAVIVALKSKEIKWSVLLDSLLSLRNRFKIVQTGSNRFKVLSLVLKFDVYSRTNGIFFGRFSVFYTWKMWKNSIFIFKIFIFEFLSRIGLNLVVISLVGRPRCLGGKARRPAETYQDPYIGEKSSNDIDKDISMNLEKLKILQKKGWKTSQAEELNI